MYPNKQAMNEMQYKWELFFKLYSIDYDAKEIAYKVNQIAQILKFGPLRPSEEAEAIASIDEVHEEVVEPDKDTVSPQEFEDALQTVMKVVDKNKKVYESWRSAFESFMIHELRLYKKPVDADLEYISKAAKRIIDELIKDNTY